MAFSRYANDNYDYTGQGLAVSRGVLKVRKAVAIGAIPIIDQLITTQVDRLDTLAGSVYGDGSYWWVLAAASNIGWGMQVPPNTIINVPDLRAVERLVG